MAELKEPAGHKKVRVAAEAMGFIVQATQREYTTKPVLYASTTDAHKEGDVRTPSKLVVEHRMIAHRTDVRIAFDVSFIPGFDGARVLDPIGKPTELFADYSYGEMDLKSYGLTRAHADFLQARRNNEYNDGEQYLAKQWSIKTATEFYLWVDDWISLLAPELKRLSAKPRTKKAEPDLLGGDDWNG